MSSYTVKSIDDLRSIHHGAVKLAAAELCVESFGMQVFDFPAGFAYPEHDHRSDGQEEVYVVLRGGATFEIDGERIMLEEGQMVRVGPECRRSLAPGRDGVRLLTIGCTVGRPYERPADFRLAVQA